MKLLFNITKFIFFISLYIAGFLSQALSDSFETMPPDVEAFPTIKMPFVVKNNMGEPEKYIQRTDFNITENGGKIPASDIFVECSESGAPVQVLFMIDQSTSMGSDVNGKPKMEWVRTALRKFFDNIDMTIFSSISIRGFCTDVDTYTDFTEDLQELQEATEVLTVKTAATDFNTAFLQEETGAIDAHADHPGLNKIVVFLSDGKQSESYDALKYNEILAAMKKEGISLYSYIISSIQDPSITSLKQLSEETGGFCRKGISPQELVSDFEDLAKSLTRIYNCLLIWKSPLYCDDEPRETDVVVRYKPASKTVRFDYTAPAWSVFKVAGADNMSYDFGNPDIDESEIREITISPTPWDMTINNIYLSDESFFKITDYGNGSAQKPSEPIKITAGQSKTFKIEFTQKENILPRQATLVLDAEPCSREILLYGGEAKIEAEITSHTEYVCDEIEITWSKIPDYCKKDIYYRHDWGNWTLIEKGVTGNSYSWRPPNQPGKYYFRVLGFPVEGINDYVLDDTKTIELYYPKADRLRSSLVFSGTIVSNSRTSTFERVFINRSQVPITFSSHSITGEDKDAFSLSPSCFKEYAPGDTGAVEITFSPNAVKNHSAELTLIPDCGEDFIISLAGYGECGIIALDEVVFPGVKVNTDRDSVVQAILENPLNKELTFSLTLGGKDEVDFSFPGYVLGNEYTIAPQEIFNIEIVFSPKTVGTKNAYLNVDVKDCTAERIDLSGRGTYSQMSIAPVNFGRERLKFDFPTRYFEISNSDAVAKSIVEVIRTSGNAFTVPANVTFPIPASGIGQVPVEFTPDLDTPDYYYFSSFLFITDTGDTLESTATGSTFLPVLSTEEFCPREFDNTDYAVLLISNPSDDTVLEIFDVTAPENSEEYSFYSKPNFPKTLAPGEKLPVYFNYTPVEDMIHSTTLSVLADNFDAEFEGSAKSNITGFDCPALFFDYIPPEFGKILICDSVSGYISEIKNKSDEFNLVLYPGKAVFGGEDAESYSLNSDDEITVKPGSTGTIEVIFKPTHSGINTAIISIPTNTSENIEILVEGVGYSVTPSASPADFVYIPGDTVAITYSFEMPPIDKSYIETLEFVVRTNRDMIFPLEETLEFLVSNDITENEYFIADSTSFTVSGNMYITGKCKLEAGKKYELFTIKYLGLLTGLNQSEIYVEMLYPCFREEFDVSTARREEVCADSISLIDFSDNLSYLDVPVPNPASNQVTLSFGLAYDATVNIDLYDIAGNQILKMLSLDLPTGKHQKQFNISSIASGNYIIVYTIGRTSYIQNLVISK
jgi:Mg-chelatase subunit ChlD